MIKVQLAKVEGEDVWYILEYFRTVEGPRIRVAGAPFTDEDDARETYRGMADQIANEKARQSSLFPVDTDISRA